MVHAPPHAATVMDVVLTEATTPRSLPIPSLVILRIIGAGGCIIIKPDMPPLACMASPVIAVSAAKAIPAKSRSEPAAPIRLTRIFLFIVTLLMTNNNHVKYTIHSKRRLGESRAFAEHD